MRSYTFTITLRGFGSLPEEAWNDALEYFMLDPGPPPEEYIMEDDEIEETSEGVYCG